MTIKVSLASLKEKLVCQTSSILHAVRKISARDRDATRKVYQTRVILVLTRNLFIEVLRMKANGQHHGGAREVYVGQDVEFLTKLESLRGHGIGNESRDISGFGE
ncbi:hypothetical protein V8G54_009817 [Vigna mungo]|uniref:Uncharacterized protein n=1 Tax=Vigna mungo TaxID=3915 RepID=A0AAQ3NVW4_VIGMU